MTVTRLLRRHNANYVSWSSRRGCNSANLINFILPLKRQSRTIWLMFAVRVQCGFWHGFVNKALVDDKVCWQVHEAIVTLIKKGRSDLQVNARQTQNLSQRTKTAHEQVCFCGLMVVMVVHIQ